MNVKLRELIAKGMGQCLASLLAGRWAAHSPSPPRRGGLPFGMLAPDDMTVVVGRCDTHQSIPDLCSPELFLCRLPRDLSLEHDVAVVRRSDDAPAVLGKKIEQASDLRQALGLLRDVLAEPCRIRALPGLWVLAVQLVADGTEYVDEDVVRTGHRRSLGLASPAPQRSGTRHRSPLRSPRARRS